MHRLMHEMKSMLEGITQQQWQTGMLWPTLGKAYGRSMADNKVYYRAPTIVSLDAQSKGVCDI